MCVRVDHTDAVLFTDTSSCSIMGNAVDASNAADDRIPVCLHTNRPIKPNATNRVALTAAPSRRFGSPKNNWSAKELKIEPMSDVHNQAINKETAKSNE